MSAIMKTLLIDDLRTKEFISMTYGIEVTDIATNFDEGIKRLQEGGWDELLLDHDLASYDSDGREKTGYDVMVWLEEQAMTGNDHLLPGSILIVSANPVGRRRMQDVIDKLYPHEISY